MSEPIKTYEQHEVTVRVRHQRAEGEAAGSLHYEENKVWVGCLTVGQLGAAMKALSPAIDELMREPDVLVVIMRYPEEAFAAVAAAIEWPVERVGRLHTVDFISVAVLIFNELRGLAQDFEKIAEKFEPLFRAATARTE